MLGKGGMYANQCLNGGFIGADFDIQEDLTMPLVSIDDWREFNKRYIPVFLAVHPDKTKVAAGLACGMLWKIVKGLEVGTVVLCSDGTGVYNVGRSSGQRNLCAVVVGTSTGNRTEGGVVCCQSYGVGVNLKDGGREQ